MSSLSPVTCMHARASCPPSLPCRPSMLHPTLMTGAARPHHHQHDELPQLLLATKNQARSADCAHGGDSKRAICVLTNGHTSFHLRVIVASRPVSLTAHCLITLRSIVLWWCSIDSAHNTNIPAHTEAPKPTYAIARHNLKSPINTLPIRPK